MPSSPHESQWIYCTILTKKLKLTAVNELIHSIPSVSLPVEIFIFACGYAFNPLMFPFWLGLIHILSRRDFQTGIRATDKLSDSFEVKWREYLQSHTVEDASLINTAFYFASVLVALAFTELGKASFATTRPQSPYTKEIDYRNNNTDTNNPARKTKWKRRYGTLVSSLKSKHSFPSGDCAQAMNLCLFLYNYIHVSRVLSIRDCAMFGAFLPGVVFARVFYWCHWVEDCIGGVVLAFILHWLLIPVVGNKMMEIITL